MKKEGNSSPNECSLGKERKEDIEFQHYALRNHYTKSKALVHNPFKETSNYNALQ